MFDRTRFEARRARIIAKIPEDYDGLRHLGWIHLVGLGVPLVCLSLLEQPSWRELWIVPAVLAFANWFEWAYHRGPLHHKWSLIPDAFRTHCLEHHVAYAHEDMAIREPRELFHILFAIEFLPRIMVLLAPLPLALSYVGGRNLGLLFYATSVGYYLLYEWLHLLHHLDPHTAIGGLPLVARLRRHHSDHHNPRWMAKYNFNISFPLWDYLLGSVLPPDSRDRT